MQIILDQTEIEQAIDAYVRSQISINDDQEVVIELKAGRGDNGFSATLDIRQAQPKTAPKKVTARRFAAAEAEPVIDNDSPLRRHATPVASKPTVATHIAARVAEDQAQADEQPEPTEVRSISANPENREPPAEPVSSIFSGVKTNKVIVDEELHEAAPAPVAAAPAKASSIFNFAPKATSEDEVA